jgi:O-antigen ligase
MTAHGDADKAIWITSFGWSVLPPTWGGAPSPWPAVSSEDQERYTAQAMSLARSSWPWLGPVLIAAWDAGLLPADDPRRGLALVDGDTDLPPAAGLRQVIPHDDTATVGTYPATHASGHYTGAWRLAPEGADVPRPAQVGTGAEPHEPAASLAIRFEGTRFDLLVRRGEYKGLLDVTVDGQPANWLPKQDGHAYLSLFDPLEEPAEVTVARYLPDGLHIAVIEAEGGWYQWPLVGWRVGREADVRSLTAGMVLAGLLALVALGGFLRTALTLPLRDWVRRLSTHYLAPSTPAHAALLVVVALAFYFVPGSLPSLALLGLLFLCVLPRPDLALALVAFSLPFFLLPKSLLGRTISMTEVLLILVAMAFVVRRALPRSGVADASAVQPAGRRRPGDPRWLDGAAYALTALGLLAALPAVLPVSGAAWVEKADWATVTLMLLPLAGVLAGLAGCCDRPKEVASQGDPGESPLQRSADCGRRSGEALVNSWWRHLVESPLRQLDAAVGALVLVALASSMAADNVGVAVQELHVVVWDAAAFYAFIRLGVAAHAGVAVRRSADEPADHQPAVRRVPGGLLVYAFLFGTTLMGSYAIYQFFFTDRAITAEGVHRALGVYGSPNNLALLLDRALPILVALLAFGRPRVRTAEVAATSAARRRLRFVLMALALVIILVALMLTYSRGALLLGLPAALVFLGIMRGRRAAGLVLAALAAVLAGILPVLGTDRLRSLLTTDSGTSFFRLRLWQSAWTMLREHPWLGVGPDNFLYQYRTRYLLPDAWQEPNLSHPHNLVLDFGTRLGIPGIAVLVWFQAAFWRLTLPLYRRLPDGEIRALLLGLMASMVATLAHGVVDNSFFLVDLAFVFCLTLGVAANLVRVGQATQSD